MSAFEGTSWSRRVSAGSEPPQERVRFCLSLDPHRERITTVGFEVLGAPDLLAAAAAVGELALRAHPSDAATLSRKVVLQEVGDGPVPRKGAVDCCLAALRRAVQPVIAQACHAGSVSPEP